MVGFYKLQIGMGKIALEDVPPKWRDDVEAAISND